MRLLCDHHWIRFPNAFSADVSLVACFPSIQIRSACLTEHPDRDSEAEGLLLSIRYYRLQPPCHSTRLSRRAGTR
jgi:hypothetical protein